MSGFRHSLALISHQISSKHVKIELSFPNSKHNNNNNTTMRYDFPFFIVLLIIVLYWKNNNFENNKKIRKNGKSVVKGDEVQVEVYGTRRSGSRRFSWANLSWKASDQEECAICLEGFRAGETLVHLPCAHRFHHGCLVPWLENNSHCPCCRTVVSVMTQIWSCFFDIQTSKNTYNLIRQIDHRRRNLNLILLWCIGNCYLNQNCLFFPPFF